MLDYRLYDSFPERDYVVLIHGIGGNSKIFFKQIKAYRKQFNVLTIHMPGHGKSLSIHEMDEPLSFLYCAKEVVKVMDHLKVNKAHFVGISLGTVIIHEVLKHFPDRVISAVQGGAVTRFNLLSKFLILWGDLLKNVTPYMWLYRLLAKIMMPKSNHTSSRELFVREAAALKRSDFIGWFKMAHVVEDAYKGVAEASYHVPKLYITGSEDHLFIKKIRKDIVVSDTCQLTIIDKCGHVCNIEQSERFNNLSMEFMRQHSTEKTISKN